MEIKKYLSSTLLITGVTKGLGRTLAEWYIANGHTVIGCGRMGAFTSALMRERETWRRLMTAPE